MRDLTQFVASGSCAWGNFIVNFHSPLLDAHIHHLLLRHHTWQHSAHPLGKGIPWQHCRTRNGVRTGTAQPREREGAPSSPQHPHTAQPPQRAALALPPPPPMPPMVGMPGMGMPSPEVRATNSRTPMLMPCMQRVGGGREREARVGGVREAWRGGACKPCMQSHATVSSPKTKGW